MGWSGLVNTGIRDGVDRKLRQQQAGFRKGRGTVEHIFILPNIIEWCIEWNYNLYVSFADFEKALDSVDRATTWRNMRSYDIPEKIVKMMVETLYNASAVGISLFIKSILKSLVILAI